MLDDHFLRADQNTGAVVASPDTATVIGSYVWDWERDAALTMRALLDTSADKAALVPTLQAYAHWALGVQAASSPFGLDTRVEPKWDIASASVWVGGWCRPQTDGPGLRGTALIMAAETLMANGKSDFVRQYLWTGSSAYNGGAIKFDLDWVVNGWQSFTCDLWEDLQGSDLFWNRTTMKKAMLVGAAFADKMGDGASASRYRSTAAAIGARLGEHWTGSYVAEASNRTIDGAVIVGFNDGYHEGDQSSDAVALAPTSARVAATVSAYNAAFCQWYQINQDDSVRPNPPPPRLILKSRHLSCCLLLSETCLRFCVILS